MRNYKILILAWCWLTGLGCAANDNIQLPFYFTDNMTLQQGCCIPIKGITSPKAKVIVTIAQQTLTTQSNQQGAFSVNLKAMPTGGPYELTIQCGTAKRTLRNVMVGDVWLCSGQSNMAFELHQARTAQEVLATADNTQLRLMMLHPVKHTDPVAFSTSLLDSLNKGYYWKTATWKVSSANNARDFSAIGYFFGQRLQQTLHIPIGLLSTAVGGAPIESYIDSTSLQEAFPPIFAPFATNTDIQDWVRGRALQNIRNAQDIEHQWHPYKPTCLYYQSVALLKDFPIKGVIWYQGESNAQDEQAHAKMFRALVASWRKAWQQPEMPFYFVQLSSIQRDNWPEFRYSQYLLSEEIPYTGIAISSDWGDSLDVHPRHKAPVGERLARVALHRTYQQAIEDKGPTPATLVSIPGKPYAVCKVQYTHALGLTTSDGETPRTFELADEDGKFYPATAVIHAGDSTITLTCKLLRKATQMRYGWQPFTRANLVNEEGLPASTFILKNTNNRHE